MAGNSSDPGDYSSQYSDGNGVNPSGFDYTSIATGGALTITNIPEYQKTARKVIDIVPYITSVTRKNDYNTIRSKLGYYPILRGETDVTISGFNLNTGDSFAISPNKSGLYGTSTSIVTASANANYTIITFTIPNTSTTASGWLRLEVSDVHATNLVNDNTLVTNKENNSSLPDTALWTDDRYLHVWQSDNNQASVNRGYFTGSIDPEYPAMTIDGSGILYGSWSNYAESDVIYAPNNGDAIIIASGYDPAEHTDIDFGSRAVVHYNSNMFGNGAWTVNGAGGSYVWDANANGIYDIDYPVYIAEALYHDEKLMQFVNQRVKNNGEHIHATYFDTDTKSLKYFYRTSGNNVTYTPGWVNIDGGSDGHDNSGTFYSTDAYLNNLNLGFELGNLTKWSTATGNPTIVTTPVDAGTYSMQLTPVTAQSTNISEYTVSGLTQLTTYTVIARARTNNFNVRVRIGAKSYNGANTTTSTATGATTNEWANHSLTFTTGAASTSAVIYAEAYNTATAGRFGYFDSFFIFSVSNTGVSQLVGSGDARVTSAGEFSAVDVTPTDNYPVIAYYDITTRTVKIARATSASPGPSQWTRQTVMSTSDTNYSFSGKYISMKIDTDGYVHLAFFRNSTGDLIYMKSTNNPTDGATAYTFGDSVIVDSSGSVGLWADITLDGSNNPAISYIDSSYAYSYDGLKIAYYDPLLEIETGDVAGQPDTTDGWEYMNAALNFEVENVRTSIERDTGTGGSKNFWEFAVGYSSTDYFRIGYYVKKP